MISIGMSTSCAFPLGLEAAFRLGRLAGYDGIEVMVTNDSTTQTAAPLLALSERYSMPILAIHAPVLLLTTIRLGPGSAGQAPERRPSSPPRSARHRSSCTRRSAGSRATRPTSSASCARSATKTGIEICVENMFPWKIAGKSAQGVRAEPRPARPRRRRHDARLLARVALRPRLARDGDGDGRPAAAHPPLRRHQVGRRGQHLRRAPRCPAAARSRSPRRCSTWRERLVGLGRRRGHHRTRCATRARSSPCSSRPSRSRASTWRRTTRCASRCRCRPVRRAAMRAGRARPRAADPRLSNLPGVRRCRGAARPL